VTNADGDLSKFREIAVVLGAGLEPDGSPTETTLVRADAAADLAIERDMAVIAAGSHGDSPARPERSEAAFMAERLRARGIASSRIFMEDESRDTVANAAYVAERYLAALAPRRLVVVTSPFHIDRSLEIFRMVLGLAWPIEGHVARVTAQDEARVSTETTYLGHARALLDGLAPGDIGRIAARVRARPQFRRG